MARAIGAVVEQLESRQLLTGTWTQLNSLAPGSVGTMLLLPNGTVMTTTDGDSAGADWGLLTPSSTGTYTNGTWKRLALAHDTRLFDASQVLPDGRVFVAGGEYGTGAATAETYDPLTNTWTKLPAQSFGSFIDAGSMLLPNGKVLIQPVSPSSSGHTTIFDPATNTWAQGPKYVRGSSGDEQSWVKLPDDSILTIDGNTTSERYIPATNSWINDAATPAAMFDGLGEIGPGLLTPSGKAVFFGATGHTLIYTPSGTTAPGTWTQGADIPNGLGCDDAPGAALPDGTILMVAGPTGTYNGPTTFYIYDPVANTFTLAAGAPSISGAPFLSRMLALPDGNILYSSGGTRLYEFNPNVTPLAAGTPTITDVTPNADGTVTLTGTGLNGLSAGAAYGDDAQMDSNYPIVRLTSGGGTVYYARTYNWSTFSVQTGALSETTNFVLPVGIPAGTYSLAVIGNGYASATTPFTISMTAGNVAPTVATAAAATPSAVTGTTTALSVLGDDDAGESNLTYTWATTSSPSTAPLPSFSINGTNAAKNVTATFYRAGTYTFQVTITDAGGLSVSSSVTVTVSQTLTSINETPVTAGITTGGFTQFSASALDQFGIAMSSQPSFTWSVTSGVGSVNSTGRYTSTSAGTLATVQVAAGGLTDTSQVGVVTAPWLQQDIGGPAIAGTAYNPASTFTVTASGSDIWTTADHFHYVYQSLTGDGNITVRVASQTNTSTSAKSGVMIRNSLSSSDIFADLFVTPGSGVEFEYRTANAGSAALGTSASGLVAPYWVRLVRAGTTITGYRSSNGTTWTQTGTISLTSLSTTADFGFMVCSHNDAALNTSTFDNVTLSQATVATAAAATPSTVSGKTTALSVLGADPNGESNLTYTWALTGQPTGGTAAFSGATNGTNAAKNITATFNKPGTYQFTVTISDGVNSSTSVTSVTVNQTLTTINVTPNLVTLNFGSTQQFSFTALDQFGATMTPSVTWSVTGTGNSITTAGLLSAGAAAGSSYTVTATSGAVHGSAGVTINAVVSNRAIFYNNSGYDGNDPNANAGDDAAIDTNLSPLLPGQAASSVNVTDAFNGINGVIIDVAGLPAGAGPAASDFSLKVGNTSDPTTWATAPSPTITLRRGAGAGGSDRIELTFADGSITNEWLVVSLLADAASGLAAADTFYFGNLVGDVNGNGIVTGSDVSLAKLAVGTTPTVTTAADVNKNGVVSGSDVSLVKLGVGGPTLTMFTPPVGPPPAPVPAAIPTSPSTTTTTTTTSTPTRQTATILPPPKRTDWFATPPRRTWLADS